MSFIENYGELIKKLYEISNPIIKFRIEKEFLNKKDININEYISLESAPIKYWLNAWDLQTIHGSKDEAFENTIAKLLEFGFSKDDHVFDRKYGFLIDDKYWKEANSFSEVIPQIVIYPFLIRAGYHTDRNISIYFNRRLELIERTIEKYGYNLFEQTQIKKKKTGNEFVFKFKASEAMPSIYDLYALAFYPKNSESVSKRIEKIIKYILDKRFQMIPDNAYVLDEVTKRYYTLGSVYHACFLSYRRLLNIYLLSFFRAGIESNMFKTELKALLDTRLPDGFYEFNRNMLIEKKNMYYIYHGSHMGLGEPSKNKNSRKIESTFWILKILHNVEG